MTTYLLTRDVKKQAITIAFCSAPCRSQWALDNITRAQWMRSVRRDDDSYEFHELCEECGELILAYIPPEDELRDQIRYALRAIRDEHIAGRITMAQAMEMLSMTQPLMV